jgi:hypothetical protein
MVNENSGVYVQGHIKIHDPKSGEVFVNKKNDIHYENMSMHCRKPRQCRPSLQP